MVLVIICSELGDVSRAKWRHLLNDVVMTCFQVADVVLPVVSHCSPEGNVPDDVSFVTTEFHTDTGQCQSLFAVTASTKEVLFYLLSLCRSVCLSVCQSVCLSVSQSVCLVCLSVCHFWRVL